MWFITCMEKMESERGLPALGDSVTWGFYANHDDAVRALHDNRTDMHEGIYQYACIERYEEGIAMGTGEIQWFKFDKVRGGYFEIATPDIVKYCCGFAM